MWVLSVRLACMIPENWQSDQPSLRYAGKVQSFMLAHLPHFDPVLGRRWRSRWHCSGAIIARSWGTARRAPISMSPLWRGMPCFDLNVSAVARHQVLCVRRNDYMCCGALRRTENWRAGHPFLWYFGAKRGICKWDVGAIAATLTIAYA